MRTKSVLPVITLLFSFFYSLNAQNIQTTDSDELTKKIFGKKVLQWQNAYNSGDANSLAPMYDANARFIAEKVKGKEAIGKVKVIDYLQKTINLGGHIESMNIQVIEVSNNLASVLCNVISTSSGLIVNSRYLFVFKKENGEWLIVLQMVVT